MSLVRKRMSLVTTGQNAVPTPYTRAPSLSAATISENEPLKMDLAGVELEAMTLPFTPSCWMHGCLYWIGGGRGTGGALFIPFTKSERYDMMM